MHGRIDWLLDFDKRPRRTLARSPRAVPWENTLPWASIMISHTAVADDRGRASVCAKAVDASTNRGVGINITAKIPNACGWCGVGRRRSGRPSGARTRPSNHSMPRPNACAVSASLLRHKRRILLRLRRRVVTQQKFFAPFLCDRPGCHEAPPKSGRHQARYCGSVCCQAVRRVRDRERKWHWRGTFRGRRLRDQEYEAARARRDPRQHDTARAPPLV